jgi:hypothetical protein
MSDEEHPDQPILDLLRQAVEVYCYKHVVLGPEDANEYFRSLVYETWQQYGLGQWNIYVEERERRAREHMKSRNTS